MELPDPKCYRLETIHNGMVAITTDPLPVPKAVIEMKICPCRMKCQTKQCKCNKLNLKCSEMCFCVDYENNEDYDDAVSGTDDSDWD